jgi:hypothetical protein
VRNEAEFAVEPPVFIQFTLAIEFRLFFQRVSNGFELCGLIRFCGVSERVWTRL